jgi:hypothetical protein
VGCRLQLSAVLAIPFALSTSAAIQAQQIEQGHVPRLEVVL